MSLNLQLNLDECALAPFESALDASSTAGAAQSTGDLLRAVRQHVVALGERSSPAYVRAHVATVHRMIDFVEHPEFSSERSARDAALGALSYFAEPQDLIPDEDPNFGLLDDAIVLDLAITRCGSAWQAFNEFVEFRRAHPAIEAKDRAACMAARLDELKLALRHRKRSERLADRRYFAATALPMFRMN